MITETSAEMKRRRLAETVSLLNKYSQMRDLANSGDFRHWDYIGEAEWKSRTAALILSYAVEELQESPDKRDLLEAIKRLLMHATQKLYPTEIEKQDIQFARIVISKAEASTKEYEQVLIEVFESLEQEQAE